MADLINVSLCVSDIPRDKIFVAETARSTFRYAFRSFASRISTGIRTAYSSVRAKRSARVEFLARMLAEASRLSSVLRNLRRIKSPICP